MIDVLIDALKRQGQGFGLVGWGESTLLAGDREVKLSWGVNTAAILEKASGKPYGEFLDPVLDPARSNLASFRLLVWALLLTHQPEMTIEEAGRVLDRADRVELSKALIEAFTSGNPQPKPEEPPAPKTRRRAGRSTTS